MTGSTAARRRISRQIGPMGSATIQVRFGEDKYPIGRFILERARALGMSRSALVRRLGYRQRSQGAQCGAAETMRNRATVSSAATNIGEGTGRSVCTCRCGWKEARYARPQSTRNKRFLP
jgi:hypothetical protein